MSNDGRRPQHAEDLLRRFGAAVRAVQLYSPQHPLVRRNMEALTATLQVMHVYDASVIIGIIEQEVVIGDIPLPRAAESMGELLRRLQSSGVERITIDRGVSAEELSTFVQSVARTDRHGPGEAPADESMALPHIRIGRIAVEQRVEGILSDTATIRHLYWDAVSVASSVWESVRADASPDPGTARTLVDGLAQAVSQNRTALLALTALKNYDNYTFTHMVNVSILTMAQARGLGVDGGLLREFGLAALMHDIGKVRTPNEVLNKPDKLTDEEFTIMKRHTIDGAEILRCTPDIPALAPVVAFEHHLRLDGTGYPEGASRSSLNLCTMLCSISDVYDAMRSQRKYQQAYPSERVLAVLQKNDGRQFDQDLVRRFVQLVGIYPAGNLVRLNTDEVAVVVRVHAPDPYRPKVRVLFGKDGRRLEFPRDVNLWEADADDRRASNVVGPVDPANYGLDPLTVM